MKEKKSEERFALVTGGNRGLGLEVCRELAKKGIHVLLTSRTEAAGKAAQSKLAKEGLEVLFHRLDVTHQDDVDRVYQFVESKWGRLDILVNNAGVLLDKSGSSD